MQEMAPRQSPRPGRKLVLLLNRLSDAMAKQKRSWECFCKADADAKGSLYPSELSKCVVCMPVCMQVCGGVHAYVCGDACIYVCMPVCMQVGGGVHAYVCGGVHACIPVCMLVGGGVHAGGWWCACRWVVVCMPAYMCACRWVVCMQVGGGTVCVPVCVFVVAWAPEGPLLSSPLYSKSWTFGLKPCPGPVACKPSLDACQPYP